MPKQNNIKWRIEDEKELRRVARNFNAKLSREIKKNPKNRSALPQFYNESTEQFESRITIEGLKELIQSRQDYNRIINMLKRFSRRGAERIVEAPDNDYGTMTTVWQRQEAPRLARIVNQRRRVRLENLKDVEMENAEGKLGYTLGERFGMGLASVNRLKPTQAFTPGQSQKDVRYKFMSILKESRVKYFNERDLMLKKNYTDELVRNYNEADIADVISKIRTMDPNLFILKFEAGGNKFEANFAYPPDRGTEEYWNYVNELKAFWLGDTDILDLGGSEALVTLLNQ